jgi:polar amino acid transport system permease protein
MLEVLHNYGLMFLIGSWPNGPIGGFAATLILSALGLGLSFPIALLLGLARISPWRPFRYAAGIWVYAFRGIPLVMIIFWAYFVVPLLTGATVPAFVTALCAIVLYESAFLAEIVRAGLQGLPEGQNEAARSAGLSYWKTMRHVLLPQALVNMLPSLVNQFVSTIKATSIVYVIGVNEVTFAAQQVNSIELTHPLQTYLILAAFYFVACYVLSQLAHLLEHRLTRRQLGTT